MEKILIVEDSRIFSRPMTKRVESELGYSVVVAASLKETIKALEEGDFSLAVLDLTLPDAPNGEVVDHVTPRNIPSIVFTGTYDPREREKILSKDVCDYIIKDTPDCLDMLLRSIRRTLLNRSTKILVVDDSTPFRQVIKRILQKARFIILEAGSAKEALEILTATPDIKVVITDYDMPEMDGVTLTTKIRQTHGRDRLAIIGVSGQEKADLSAKFLKRGANDFIAKPFSSEEIYNRIVMNMETIERFHEIEEKNKKLLELDQLKNKFLGIASHDLRNPLVSIRGFSELLLTEAMGPVAPEQKEFISMIHGTSNDMLAMVNDLLDISVIESGKLTLQERQGSIQRIVEERLRLIEISATNKGMAINKEIDEVEDFSFDPARISQVMDNFLTNAVKFSPSGSTILVSLAKKDREVVFSVRDQGPGLSAEDQQKLFGEFQKLSAAPTGGEKSTGLGLSIAKKIVTAHNGRIWAESEAGHGATFSFSLPMEK